MDDKLYQLIISNEIPIHLKLIPYGTAGYRMNYQSMDGIAIRMSCLAFMRSLYTSKSTGIMITASHNPECDNGIKIIDPDGEMLTRDWEIIAMEFVEWCAEDFLDKFHEKCLDLKIIHNQKGKVFVGYDTRKSSPHLAEIIVSVLQLLGCECSIHEYVTTPQLHFFVKHTNDNPIIINSDLMKHYFDRLSDGFCMNKQAPKQPPLLNVDCANGVGGKHLLELSKIVSTHLNLKLHNITTDNLNFNCGADYVKIKQSVPVIHNGDCNELVPGSRWCSIDGDADRIIYFFISQSNQFKLLDGDKMAVLIADFLSDILKTELESNQFSMAIIQTAYANSASTEYIENRLKIKSECVPTGVKYLHHAAKKYDIGIYFEANGHGTVLFSEKLRKYSETLNADSELKRFISIINEADGDAISDLLIIEHILFIRNWDLEYWSQLYTDYPSRQLKVPVPDRNIIVTTDAERKIQSPITLQNAIDKAVEDQLKSGLKHSRAFVRPSGTEDIVRIYAESSNQESVDQLAYSIELAIKKILIK